MPSVALQNWLTVRATGLNQIESAHRSVGGTGPGRRYATLQINQAYAVLLAGQFQAFCRDLHTECVDFLVASTTPPTVQPILHAELVSNRRLDRGNASAVNIGW